MIKTYLTDESGELETGGLELIERWRVNAALTIWIDIQSDQLQRNDISALLEELNCHPLAVTDALRKRHPPKFELFKEQIFMLYRGINHINGTLDIDHQQIAFFVSERALITTHPRPAVSIQQLSQSAQLAQHLSSPLALALTIMHTSAGIYLEHILEFETELSEQEERLYGSTSEAALQALASYKARLIRLKRVFNYHKNLSAQLKHADRASMPFDISAETHLINDVDDRLERLFSMAQLHYDICGDMIDSYISITSHQLNMTMRVLTVITAIFVPLSFLAGIYGMNFEHIPELHFRHGYFILLGIMSLIAVTLFATFKRKRWF